MNPDYAENRRRLKRFSSAIRENSEIVPARKSAKPDNMSDAPNQTRLDRRSALKFFAVGAAAPSLPLQAEEAKPATVPPIDPVEAKPRGTSTDPDLVQINKCPWPKVLTAPELKTITVLSDIILPEDEKSPSASKAGVPDFINEWVSAPYEKQRNDLQTVRSGLAWLNTESFKQHQASFTDLKEAHQLALCDAICSEQTAKPEHAVGAKFFTTFKGLCLSGFYSSAAGFQDLSYRGNSPIPQFPGPPEEVLKHLGLV